MLVIATLDDSDNKTVYGVKNLTMGINLRRRLSLVIVDDACPGYLTHPFDILGFSMKIFSEVGCIY